MRNENTQRLEIPGITPETLYVNVEEGKQIYCTTYIRGASAVRSIKFEAAPKRFITNKYIKCLHDICRFWDDSYYILDTLISHSIIKQRVDYSLEWALNKTSLAWLFKNMKVVNYNEDNIYFPIPGGFWNPIAILFGEKRETLKKLINNKNTYAIKHNGKKSKSEDIEKLQTILKENGIQL